jgi:hypothetical protein
MGSSQPETTVDLTKRSGSRAGAGRMEARASVRDGRRREFTAGDGGGEGRWSRKGREATAMGKDLAWRGGWCQWEG